MSSTADTALPQQNAADPLDVSPVPEKLGELSQRCAQKLQRRDHEHLDAVRQLYTDVHAMKDRDTCSQKAVIYEDAGAMVEFKDDVAEQFIPVALCQKRKVRKNGSVRSHAYWQRVKRLNIRLQGRGKEHARKVDEARKAIQRMTEDRERAMRNDLGYLMQLSDAEADILLKDLSTECEDSFPSEQHGNDQPAIVVVATASPPPEPSPLPPAIELLPSSDCLPAPSSSTTEPTTSKSTDSTSSKPIERPSKRHVTGFTHLDIHESPEKKLKWDCSGVDCLAHEGDWKCSLCDFFNLDSHRTCWGHDEDETDCLKERDDEDVVVKRSAIHSVPVLAGYEVWIRSDETQAAYALLKLAGEVRE
ncbi:hypothetical protein E8E11_009490 [Didymella keratinophila]|nr:hypothetical protein E8E11_009490 [Didymella keratinophila]